MTVKEAIEKYVGLKTIEGISEIRKNRNINDYLDIEINKDHILFIKDWDDEHLIINFEDASFYLEYKNKRWYWRSGCTPDMDEDNE